MKLTEYTKDEWFSVARLLKPGLTREDYESMWARFCEHMRRREAH